jgi:hypothetical protein
MSFLDGFAGGAAGAGADILQDERKSATQVSAAKSLADYNSELDLKKVKAIEEMKNAGLGRISAGAQAKMNEEVPLEAAPVKSVSGTNEAGEKFGFEGDIATQRKAIETIADPVQRQEAMDQLNRQVAGETKQGLINVVGKTRKRTADEALDAAVSDAKVNDLPAYADYEARVGKPLRDERRIDVSEKKSDAAAANAAKEGDRKAQADARKFEIDLKRLDLQQGGLDAQNRKIDAWIDNESTKRENDEAKAAGGKGQSPDKLGAIVNAMNASIKNLNDGSHGNTPEEKADWKRQVETFARVRDRASQLLDAGLTDRGAPATPTKPAAPGAPAKPGARPPLSSFQK